MSVYGYCPTCGAPGVSRTRGGPNSKDTCQNGHVYPAVDSVSKPKPDDTAANISLVGCGHAPGLYMCKCDRCGSRFEGDKRAVTCLDCAVHILTERHRSERPALRVGLRLALLRVFGSRIGEVSDIFRSIEAGMSVSDATDALEALIRNAVTKEREDAQAVYKREFYRR